MCDESFNAFNSNEIKTSCQNMDMCFVAFDGVGKVVAYFSASKLGSSLLPKLLRIFCLSCFLCCFFFCGYVYSTPLNGRLSPQTLPGSFTEKHKEVLEKNKEKYRC